MIRLIQKKTRHLLRISTFSALLLACCLNLFATHNRAGEIVYISAPLPDQPYRYEFQIITYTRTGSMSDAADRDSLEVDFGDGSPIELAPRTNGLDNGGEVIPSTTIKKNIYTTAHNFPGPFDYIVSVTDPNRISGIININFGASVEIPFFLQANICFRDPQFFGFNSSPVLFQPPIDNANVGYPFIHNPNAFDPDGDDLLFELVPPKVSLTEDVPVYQYPNQVDNGSPTSEMNEISLNPETGEFVWEVPQKPGIYNIAFKITEFRNGLKIGNLIRDMQIIVKDVNNDPPEVATIQDTCVVIGETFELDLFAEDPNEDQIVTISAFGGPLEIPPIATLSNPTSGQGQANTTLTWQTDCTHIYSQAYTLVIKAEDDFVLGALPFPLVDLETWQLQLVPQPVTELIANVVNGEINLFWTPHTCSGSDKFRGYSVYRRIGCDSLDLDNCQTDLTDMGYEKITDAITDTTFIDDTVLSGVFYSYRVAAEFADAFTGTNPPNPINVISGLPSENICIDLPKDVPIITNVSISVTSENNGEIAIAWSKPRAEPLDTLVNLPPYRYELYRSTGFGAGTYDLIETWEATSYATANDTTYTDQGNLNSLGNPYSYRVAFYSQNNLVGETEIASSVFVLTTPVDNAVVLDWEFNVPWLNYEYEIQRQDDMGVFQVIANSIVPTYTDENLQNGQLYCYRIKATGTYGSMGLLDPLLNYSQEICSSPLDTIPPCPPVLMVSTDCNIPVPDGDNIFENNLQWTRPIDACADDVVGYRVYYASAENDPNFELITELEGINTTFYQHLLENSLAGCYYVTAIDSFMNESIASNDTCIMNCLNYELPNVFTPNDDGDNDLFVPRQAQFVSSVDMTIYNRWGHVIYQTANPLIEWDGTDSNTGNLVPEGTYYYTCEVYETSNSGMENIGLVLEGFIELIIGK
ncbi:MAG: gliding motility-associated C-terminal domain-containing protein [Chitinophagales bacterium]